MEWKQEPQLVTQKTLRIGEISVRPFFRDEERVERIVLVTNVGNVTFKPKVIEETFKNGIKFTKLEYAKATNLPQVVLDMGKAIQAKGYVNVVGNYMKGSMDKDGEETFYRWIQGQAMLEKWMITENQNILVSDQTEEVVK